MGLQIISRNNPYNEEYIHKKINVGLEPEFQTSRKGIRARKAVGLRSADHAIAALNAKQSERFRLAKKYGIKNPGSMPGYELDELIENAQKEMAQC